MLMCSALLWSLDRRCARQSVYISCCLPVLASLASVQMTVIDSCWISGLLLKYAMVSYMCCRIANRTYAPMICRLLMHANTSVLTVFGHYASIIILFLIIIIAIQTVGLWSQQAIKLVQEIWRCTTVITEDSRETTFLFQRLSVALQRENAVSFLGTVPQDSQLVVAVISPFEFW